MPFDVQAAKKSGYSDAEIADYLAKDSGFDAAGARKAGYSDAEIVSHLTASAQPAPAKAPQPVQSKAPDPTDGMGTLEKIRAGAGKGMVSAVRGLLGAEAGLREKGPLPVKLLLGAGAKGRELLGINSPTSAQLADAKAEADRLDAPLMNTGAGKVGNVIGNAVVAAPAALIPGANTYMGAALIGAGTGALTTEGGLEDRAKSGLFGAAGGAAGKGLGDVIGKGVSKAVAGRAAAKTADQARVSSVKTARDAGYVLPPTEIKPTMLNSLTEGISGKIKTSQAASAKNQEVTNTLAKRAIGLAEDQPITKEAISAVRSEAGRVYNDLAGFGQFSADPQYVKSLATLKAPLDQFEKQFPQLANKEVAGLFDALGQNSFESGAAVEALKRFRFDGQANLKSLDPAKKELGRVQVKAAGILEDLIERNLQASGDDALMGAFRNARQTIAKTYSVEKALNETTGNVSASSLSKELSKGKPLSGDLRTIAEVGQAFPKATQALSQNYNAVSPLDYAAGVGLGTATANPAALAAVVARPALRSLILSKPAQALTSASANPNRTKLSDLLLKAGGSKAIRPAFTLSGMALAADSAKK